MRRSRKKRQIQPQTSGRESPASQPSEMMVPMMRGCPSANAAHARPRGVRDSEGERPPPALTNSKSVSQRIAAAQSSRSAVRVASSSAWSALRPATAAPIFGRSSPCSARKAPISARASFCCFGVSRTAVPPKSPEAPASRFSSAAYRSAAWMRRAAAASLSGPSRPARAAAIAACISVVIAAARRRIESFLSVRSRTSGPMSRWRWRRTKGRSTVSCETAEGIRPQSISRSSIGDARFRSPATDRVGA
mmetsp:Transcript_11952/g.35301  ORF Transcript_11952/g.35301 Transcript_11952/m.35301 type:complete len:249 (-) Transcript_11952:724-1470(-)